jgi:NAD-dependent deacetylase
MESLVKAVSSAKHILFVTGAGISTGSGLPTYRGVGGLYKNNFIPPEIRMSEFVFRNIPSLTWAHFHKVFKKSTGIKPNQAHIELANIQKFFHKVSILTQNVDGLHQDAGSENVIEIHGSARYLVCKSCKWMDVNPDLANLPRLPRCPKCKSIVRPPVVLFGGNLPDAEVRKLESLYYTMEPDVVFGIGTTAMFHYILEPFQRAKELGKTTIILDPEPAKHLENLCDYVIKESAETFLPTLFENVIENLGMGVKPNFSVSKNNPTH